MTRRSEQAVDTDGKAADARDNVAPPGRKAVIKYIIILIAVVLFFVVLSYFIQQRNHTELNQLYQTAQENIKGLQDENLRLTDQAAADAKTISDLQQQIKDLQTQLNDLQTSSQESQTALTDSKDKYDELLTRYNDLLDQYNALLAQGDQSAGG